MSTEPTPAERDDVPEWATATPPAYRRSRQQRQEIAWGTVMALLGLGLLLASLLLVGLEVHEILTQPRVMGDETVVERIGWRLFPGVFALWILLPLWLGRNSIDE